MYLCLCARDMNLTTSPSPRRFFIPSQKTNAPRICVLNLLAVPYSFTHNQKPHAPPRATPQAKNNSASYERNQAVFFIH